MTQPASLQARLLWLVLGGVLLMWLVAGIATWFDARHELDELLDGHLAQSAALLVARQARELGEHDDDDDEPLPEAAPLHRYAPRVAFQIWHEGRLVLRSTNAPAQPMSPQPRGFATLAIAGQDWRVFGARGAERDVQVYVGEQMRSRGAIMKAVLKSLLWPLAIALPLLGLAGWVAVRQGLAPLRRLGAALAARRPDALEPVRLDGAPVEVQRPIDALNALFERIASLLDAERRFTADAAHELRTPIAAIRAQAQVALGASDDAERRRALASTLEGCDRATHLVEQLLTLARLEAGAGGAPSPLDLAALTRRVLAAQAGTALDRQQHLELDAPQRAPARGHEALLEVLLRNLVDNALRYGPPGTRVQVRIAADRGGWRLQVDDSGPGLTDAERARLGERFFRVPGHAAAGSGLGWSIVRRIAALHGAAVDADRSAVLGGLAVALWLPGDAAAPPRSTA